MKIMISKTKLVVIVCIAIILLNLIHFKAEVMLYSLVSITGILYLLLGFDKWLKVMAYVTSAVLIPLEVYFWIVKGGFNIEGMIVALCTLLVVVRYLIAPRLNKSQDISA